MQFAAQKTTYGQAREAAQQALDRGALSEALLLLSPWHGDPSLPAEETQALNQLLSELAGTVVYSTDYHTEPPYAVQAGETLQTIADKYQVPDELLARINGLDATAPLTPGQQLKVVRGPFAAAISLTDRTLILNVGGYYAGRFAVGVGSEQQDLEGIWVVKHKLINPTYYGRDRVIDADDPSNPLGEHWLGLASAASEATVHPFGIHGTADPESIERDDPRGYIRLKPDDARDLYDILSIGSQVVVRR
jgi:lipoprotein-anchoring transpeptidase ErfK/SrfK